MDDNSFALKKNCRIRYQRNTDSFCNCNYGTFPTSYLFLLFDAKRLTFVTKEKIHIVYKLQFLPGSKLLWNPPIEYCDKLKCPETLLAVVLCTLKISSNSSLVRCWQLVIFSSRLYSEISHERPERYFCLRLGISPPFSYT